MRDAATKRHKGHKSDLQFVSFVPFRGRVHKLPQSFIRSFRSYGGNHAATPASGPCDDHIAGG